jgi:hypothetical protein
VGLSAVERVKRFRKQRPLPLLFILLSQRRMLHRKVAEVAKKRLLLSVPRNSWGRQKELFWRIGLWI